MAENSFINILIAEDNDVTRDMMAGLLRAQGYNILPAAEGSEAIKILENEDVNIALVDIKMSPVGGLEIAKHVVSEGLKVPIVFITGDDSADLLIEASALGVSRVLQKPVEPKRLIDLVNRMLQRQGLNPSPLAVETREVKSSPEQIMQKVIDLAAENARSGRGRPFGAVVADASGQILGEGVNGAVSRADPIAHAEVMAIRKAAEKLGKEDLSDCVLYCSSQPTAMGDALIRSVGIKEVYYGLSHEDVGQIRTHVEPSSPVYKQLGRDAAMTMFQNTKKPD